MKGIFFLFLLLSSSILFAQSNIIKHECNWISTDYPEGVKYTPKIYEYEFNANKQITKKSTFEMKDGKKIATEIQTFTYDELGNELTDFTKYCDWSGQWINKYRYERTYAGKKELTFKRFAYRYIVNSNRDYVLVTGKDSMYTELNHIYVYDNLGNITEHTFQKYDTAQKVLVNQWKQLSKFNESGLEIESITMDYDLKQQKFVNGVQILNTYNEKKNRILEVKKIWKNGKWVDSDKWDWLFTKSDSIEFRNTYQYFSKELGNLKKTTDKDGWKKVQVDRWFYNEKGVDFGNATMTLNPLTDSLVVTEQEQYESDEYGNRLAKVIIRGEFVADGNVIPIFSETTRWEYNNIGDEVTSVRIVESRSIDNPDKITKESTQCTDWYDTIVKKGPSKGSNDYKGK